MGQNTAPERPSITPASIRTGSISLVGQLDDGELLTGTPLVTEETTSDLAITNKVVSTSALTISKKSVPIGKAVQFLVSGQLKKNSPYTIRVVCATDSTPAQTVEMFGVFETADS